MASSPPFDVEDTDEDFFDKLVEDDDDDEVLRTLSAPSFSVDNYANQLKAFSNLSIREVRPTGVDHGGKISAGNDDEKGLGDEVVMAAVDAPDIKLVDSESTVATANNIVQCSDAHIGDLNTAAGVKVVDWSTFNSDSHLHRGSEFGSYSDFFSEAGDNSVDPFSKVNDTEKISAELKGTDTVSVNPVAQLSSVQHQEGQHYETGTIQNVDGPELNSFQGWENAYPGWRYDPNTGQWHQLDGYTADAFTNVTTQEKSDANALQATDMAPEQKSELYYSQQTTQSNVGSIAEAGTTGTISDWNQVSQENTEYPAHMFFDPQYPGWYYDMNVQEWILLESYTTAIKQSTNVDYNQQNQDVNSLRGGSFSSNIISDHGISGQVGNYQSTGISGQGRVSWNESINNYQHTTWQPGQVPKSEGSISQDNQFGNVYDSRGHEYNSTHHQSGSNPLGENVIHGQNSQGFHETNGLVEFQSLIPAGSIVHPLNHSKIEPTQQMNGSPSYFQSKNSASFSQQPPHSFTQFSHPSNEGRSSAGRPPHPLVTFGFGGKLVVMRDNSSSYEISAFNNQDSAGGVVNVFNLAEVVMDKIGASNIGFGVCDYFQSLCQKSFPGPLAGGSVGSKELNKWIDEKIANGECPDRDYSKGEMLKKLFCLLKIACQHYGNVRSPFSNDQALKDSETPESAVAKLFASDSEKGALVREYGNHTSCLHKLPQESHSQATALNVQQLLVSGRKKEALECAQQGQLWGPALVLAHQLGDQFYGDTLKKMALQQFVAGSPLRTLCLLIAGQPADVFTPSSTHSNVSNAYNIPQQPVQIWSNNILDQWEENLAIITANRTKDDERVITHLGDCLWKERGEVIAAHICYLVAEVNIEPHSDSARLCLIGADHWKCARTYASPEAIQRTELYEYSKVLGNPQSVLLPFQPYKLIYAHMLAEVGKLSDSLKYCQAILKSLKTGRTPEADTWIQLLSSLEERIRTHQQGGFGTNLAPTKIVGKLFSFFDKTAHHVVGGLPPPAPMSSHVQPQYIEHAGHQQGVPRVANSQSTMAMSTLMPSASMEPINEWTGGSDRMAVPQPQYIEHAGHQQGVPRVANSQSTMAMSTLMPSASMEPINEWTGGSDRMAVPNRSISEPDFGKTPAKVDSSKEANTMKTSGSGGSSRFGRFGSQIFQKTVGLVIRSRPDKQAKLGDKNRFYYDENLKRWVEEGVEPPAEAAALPPPPTVAVFQNGRLPDQNGINFSNEIIDTSSGPEIKNQMTSERSPGIPPMPPSSNQFSARGRMGGRARYVDTFNKGGGSPVNLFQSPSIAKSGGTSNPSFFVPPPAVSSEETLQLTGENAQDTVVMNENLSSSDKADSMSSPPTSTISTSSSVSMQRFPSMDSIVQRRMENDNNALHPQSRRAASWSGGLCDENNKPLNRSEIKPLSRVSGLRHSPSMPSNPPSMRFSAEDLHEVQL